MRRFCNRSSSRDIHRRNCHGADPVVGAWKLDVAKSKFSPGPALKSANARVHRVGGRCTLDAKTVGPTARKCRCTWPTRPTARAIRLRQPRRRQRDAKVC